jgi:hypothetical protein
MTNFSKQNHRPIANSGADLQRKISCLWKEPGAGKPYRRAVSLHSHTNHSKEGLHFIAKYVSRSPFLRTAQAAVARRAMKVRGIVVDFHKAFWTPPLPPLGAFQVERNQIEQKLGLEGMVSLSDHDTIEAPMLLRVVPEAREIPVSVEWTAPYQGVVFHVGIHNLPSARAASLMADLGEYTRNPSDGRLPELLTALHQMPEVLIVLNHPMWDLMGTGADRHERALRALICAHGQLIHALELNGMRSWHENQSVLRFSEACNQVVISGGDRHGCEPNANLNLTNAESFSEFVHQIRRERISHLLFMPQYTEPFALRALQTLLDATREYPDYPVGSQRWDERTYHQDKVGVLRPMGELWERPQFYVAQVLKVLRLLETAPIRRALQLALTKPEADAGFAAGERQEATL